MDLTKPRVVFFAVTSVSDVLGRKLEFSHTAPDPLFNISPCNEIRSLSEHFHFVVCAKGVSNYFYPSPPARVLMCSENFSTTLGGILITMRVGNPNTEGRLHGCILVLYPHDTPHSSGHFIWCAQSRRIPRGKDHHPGMTFADGSIGVEFIVAAGGWEMRFTEQVTRRTLLCYHQEAA